MGLKKISIAASFFAIAMVQNGWAKEITIIGSLPQTIKKTDETSLAQSYVHDEKIIQLLKVQLSEEAKAALKNRARNALTPTNQLTPTAGDLPQKKQLGMNKVPVLDQGMHGTCVTFAVTGTLDALMGKGDYISQLCNLQLGSYLEKHGYGSSGWEGTYAKNVVKQIEQYGVVSKKKQHKVGCGGLKKYPTYTDHKENSFMDPEEFGALSHLIFGKKAIWSDILKKDDPEQTLNAVKEAINAGDRMAFAVLFPRTDLGTVGAVGKHNTWFFKDSWVLTPEILKGVDNIEAAHEMIITGYDDKAEAVDNHGKKHKGLLTLRNSWGADVGDWGEFYMSYDYFKLLAFDVTRFSSYRPN